MSAARSRLVRPASSRSWSPTSAPRARSWLETVAEEDGVRVTMPILAAPPSRSTMILDYNPPGLLPYFCLVDELGPVAERGTAGGEWYRMVETWRSVCAVRL